MGFGGSGYFSPPWRGGLIWTRNNKSKLVFLKLGNRKFRTFYAIFMEFHENSGFLVIFTKKGGITRKFTNFHEFRDFRPSGAAKGLGIACITMPFAGSVAGRGNLVKVSNHRKKVNFMEFHAKSGK